MADKVRKSAEAALEGVLSESLNNLFMAMDNT